MHIIENDKVNLGVEAVLVFPDAGMIVPGHGEPGDIELLAHTRDLVQRRF